MNQVTTKTQLIELGMDALDRDRVGQVQVSPVAGGISFASALEVMEFAKLLSTAQSAIPPAFRNNPGICLAVVFQAIEWRMSPVAVINKAYIVNDRLAYESQLLHGIIEARGPLIEPLDCSYEGEGPTRTCTVMGKFMGNVIREYTSPMLKDIRVKNSPLWTSDPDQQLFYYASRAWARKWCPHVLMGIYSREEVEANEGFRDEPQLPGLAQRLSGSERPKEGFAHDNGVIEQELNAIVPDTARKILPAEKPAETIKPAEPEKPRRRLRRKAEEIATEAEPKVEANKPPTTAMEYDTYAHRWIEAETDKDNALARWEGEDEQRNDLKVPVQARINLRAKINAKFGIEE